MFHDIDNFLCCVCESYLSCGIAKVIQNLHVYVLFVSFKRTQIIYKIKHKRIRYM